MTLVPEIKIKPLKLDDEGKKKFIGLHNILFTNTAMTIEWLDWYLKLFGTKEIRVYGAFNEKEDMVGMWCVEPRTFLADHSLQVGRCFAVGVHPSYQRKGIFTLLSRCAITSEKFKKEYTHILGFPQHGKTVIDGHLKAGWEFIQDIDIMSIHPNVVDPQSTLSRASNIGSFEGTRNVDGAFLVNAEFRDSRWIDHPTTKYINLRRNSAHAVIKQYGDSAHILDLVGHSEDVSDLLEVTKTLSKRHGWNELNMWCAYNSENRPVAKAAGFQVGASRAHSVKLLAVNVTAPTKFEIPACNFSMGVEEIY